MTSFTIENIFSLACRDRCLAKLRTMIPLPNYGKPPSATAAVLVPLCRINETPSLLYTIRSNNLQMHTGNISFPGGKSLLQETPVETALRKTYEDLGIDSKKINVWGQGPAIPSSSNDYLITPVIGVIPDLKEADFKINLDDIAEAFTVPIHMLCNTKNQFYTQYSDGTILPVFIADDYKIWGITAYITHAFLTCTLSRYVYQNEWLKSRIDIKNED